MPRCRASSRGIASSRLNPASSRVGRELRWRLALGWAKRGTRPSAPHDQRTSSLHLRGRLPCRGKRRRARPAVLQHRGYIPPPRGNLGCGHPGRPRGPGPGSPRVARLREPTGPAQHHALAAAAQITRVEPGREYLADHARQLALQPRLQILPGHPDHCCYAWNRLTDMPWKIISIATRDWAYRS